MVDARRLVTGVMLAAAWATSVAAEATSGRRPAPSDSGTSASSLYKDALATTHSWSVHYDSTSTESRQTLVESGDAGPASGSQTVTMGKGTISIFVIGGISYVKGNVAGLESLAGFSSSQAAEATGQWIEFSTDNSAFAPVVDGVRSADVAKELALRPPLSLGQGRTLHGESVDAIDGTQTFGKKSQHVVLYVRAQRNPRSGRGGLGEFQGTAHGRRAHHLLEVGRAGAARGAHGDHLGRLHKRRLRKRRPTPVRPAGVGRWGRSPTLAEPALAAPPSRASRRVKVMPPLRHNHARTAAVATGLAAAAALALARCGRCRRSHHHDRREATQRNGSVQRGPEGRRHPGACTSTRSPSRTAPSST